MQVIGVGVGRTGTFSLKLAIERLGFGPCHHMEAVIENMPAQVPLWSAAIAGDPDWPAIYNGYQSAVDWPTAGFYRQLYATYPNAKFILTHRSPESWAASFSGTIQKLIAGRDNAPPPMQDWLQMAENLIAMSGFPVSMNTDDLQAAFIAHNDAVKETIPAEQLLVYEVKEGWAPLCDFLGKDAPDEPFPRTNQREQFWEMVKGSN